MALRELSTEECRERLSGHAFLWRLGFVVHGRPMVLPVNYVVDGESIVFCTETGTKLSAVVGGAPVVFEIDDARPLYHSGWSVLAEGVAREVTDQGELERLRHGPLRPWAVRPSAHWVRIEVTQLSGREISES